LSVVLSGDVHQAIGSADQGFTQSSESAIASEYARRAADYGLKVTLFVTGRAMIDNSTEVAPLLKMDNVEIGGHGWDALRPLWWHGMLNRLTGSPHGLPTMQQRMIQRTCSTIQALTGRPVRSWRNHAYRHDRHTARLLAAAKVKVWSDAVEPEMYTPSRHSEGVVILPINTTPDHENLWHGARTPASVADENNAVAYPPMKWCDQVCSQVETILDAGGVATILAHPICMKISDNWNTFDRLCRFLSKYKSLFAREVAK